MSITTQQLREIFQLGRLYQSLKDSSSYADNLDAIDARTKAYELIAQLAPSQGGEQ
mgnify:CR=1 FL=1